MKPDICIYHDHCDDGFAAAFAVYLHSGNENIEFVPCSYGDAPPDVTGKSVLVVDFSFKRDVLLDMAAKAKCVVVLDHHKTAKEDLQGLPRVELEDAEQVHSGLWVHFDMNKSGCRLAWEFMFGDFDKAPVWMHCIEDRDLWRFDLPHTKVMHAAIRSFPRKFEVWKSFNDATLSAEGAAIRRYIDRVVNSIADNAFKDEIGGYIVPVANCSADFSSEVAHELLNRNEDAPFVACVHVSKEGYINASLRSTDDRLDVSEIAKEYGGGGHRNAAGFRME